MVHEDTVGIVFSKQDPASTNVRNALVHGFGFKESDETYGGDRIFVKGAAKLLTIEGPLTHSHEFDKERSFKLLIFVSRHVSKSGTKTFTTHSIGNWTASNEFGGAPKTLSPTSASALSLALRDLLSSKDKHQLDDFSVTLEATHHGPLTTVPTIFVEIGSSLEEWNNLKAAETVADTCLSISKVVPQSRRCAVAFGGPHYAPKFTQVVLQGEFEVGHIAPKSVFPIDGHVMTQAFESTVEGPGVAVIDWKGLKSDVRKNLCEKLVEMDIELVKR